MSASPPNPSSANTVTHGEILVGIVWLVVYGLFMFDGLSAKFTQLASAIHSSETLVERPTDEIGAKGVVRKAKRADQ